MTSFREKPTNRSAHQAHLDDYTVVALGEDGSIVIDIRHIDVHSGCVDSGWTAIVGSLNRERVA
jgi:hypothetical protein